MAPLTDRLGRLCERADLRDARPPHTQVFAVTTVVAGLASFTLVLALVEQVGAAGGAS